jgi:hypothetical protein
MVYGTGKNREEMEERQIKLICPIPINIGQKRADRGDNYPGLGAVMQV